MRQEVWIGLLRSSGGDSVTSTYALFSILPSFSYVFFFVRSIETKKFHSIFRSTIDDEIAFRSVSSKTLQKEQNNRAVVL